MLRPTGLKAYCAVGGCRRPRLGVGSRGRRQEAQAHPGRHAVASVRQGPGQGSSTGGVTDSDAAPPGLGEVRHAPSPRCQPRKTAVAWLTAPRVTLRRPPRQGPLDSVSNLFARGLGRYTESKSQMASAQGLRHISWDVDAAFTASAFGKNHCSTSITLRRTLYLPT
ncbi:hypothetical protein SAFG77S_00897 [Streptomyces afghaniensis]